MSILETVATIAAPELALPLRILGVVKSGAGKVVDWATSNAAHLLLIVLSATLAWGWLGHHNAAKWEKVAAQTRNARADDNRTWTGVDQKNHATIDQLIDTLNGQSRMVRAWGDMSRRRQDAAQAALRAATTRGAHMEALAGAIELEHAQSSPSWPACRSGKAVMAAKGDL